ncbi:TRAFs-binding domain-containing protein [Nonomuraea sp. NPDC048882]|uniref:TRAFs-binding domain-containing protein n=1 Tax=Nonomuraea sp. NPDC048882 TaxID=3154347 RepID=UPI0033CD8EF2
MSNSVAFMVMPFGRKPTGRADDGVPAVVDFDALWERVHEPLLTELGYRAIRADSDLGALVIVQMIQRLALADVVMVDVSLPNSNVYYEVGVRHAAQRIGCVLVAATWAEPVFEALPGYPEISDGAQLTPFTAAVDMLSDFQADVRAIQLTSGRRQRQDKTRALVARFGAQPVIRESVVLKLLRLIEDNLEWEDVLAYIDTLPDALQRHPPVIERRQLAPARTGKAAQSAGALELLIERVGPSSERMGLLGGRYKDLMHESAGETSRDYLDQAITAYERGMTLDLNDYYPASNLPRLYRLRGGRGDEERAAEVATIVLAACQAGLVHRPWDEWALPTRLGAAFDKGMWNWRGIWSHRSAEGA